jgi:hypothetical protein
MRGEGDGETGRADPGRGPANAPAAHRRWHAWWPVTECPLAAHVTCHCSSRATRSTRVAASWNSGHALYMNTSYDMSNQNDISNSKKLSLNHLNPTKYKCCIHYWKKAQIMDRISSESNKNATMSTSSIAGKTSYVIKLHTLLSTSSSDFVRVWFTSSMDI